MLNCKLKMNLTKKNKIYQILDVIPVIIKIHQTTKCTSYDCLIE